MQSYSYDALKIHMKQLAMRCDTIHPYYDAVRFDSIQHNAIQCNTMQWKKYKRFYFFGSDKQQIIS